MKKEAGMRKRKTGKWAGHGPFGLPPRERGAVGGAVRSTPKFRGRSSGTRGSRCQR